MGELELWLVLPRRSEAKGDLRGGLKKSEGEEEWKGWGSEGAGRGSCPLSRLRGRGAGGERCGRLRQRCHAAWEEEKEEGRGERKEG
eukprot:3552252-Rhodomonas_salina.1